MFYWNNDGNHNYKTNLSYCDTTVYLTLRYCRHFILELRPSRVSNWFSRRWRVVRRSNFSRPSRRLITFWAWITAIMVIGSLFSGSLYRHWEQHLSTFITRYNCRRLGRLMPSVVSNLFPLSSKVTRFAKQLPWRPFNLWMPLPAGEVPKCYVQAFSNWY